ncbi:MAG TPA: hypothetical protein VF123_11255 [Candidatus Sulfotelmatobacter sp.]
MGSLSRGLLSAVFAMVALDLPFTTRAQAQENPPEHKTVQKVAADPGQVAPQLTYAALSELPDSPGSVREQQQDHANQQNGSAATQTEPAASPQANPPSNQPGDTQTNQKLQRPVGTAAAEAPRVSGITAAQPAGIAIAPAKQHRVRTLVIKVGAILGAGAAVGTVIALTQATPSKPPGAH